MFTGIVEAVGEIVQAKPFEVDCRALGMADLAIGDSICVQGVCLTVTSLAARGFRADVSAATLGVTVGLDQAGPVNLEKSLALGERLGGHFVAGHVDGVGEVTRFDGGTLEVRAPQELVRYIARKGSICIDGVSLTVNRVEGRLFEANLIPHTLVVTTLGRLRAGARVNLEVDLLARYVARLLEASDL
jgi:riboflavin synthase